MTQRYCFALDLQDDEQLIHEYEAHHQHVWSEVIDSIKQADIEALDIYRTGNRLFMIMEVNENFSFANKAAKDAANPVVQQWEELMWKFQKALPWGKKDEKWVLMSPIFQLPK